VYGQLALGFALRAENVLAITATALAAQGLLGRWVDGARFEPRSALISALSLCLLLRTEAIGLRASPSLARPGGFVRGCQGLPPRASRTRRDPGADARRPHGLGHREGPAARRLCRDRRRPRESRRHKGEQG